MYSRLRKNLNLKSGLNKTMSLKSIFLLLQWKMLFISILTSITNSKRNYSHQVSFGINVV